MRGFSTGTAQGHTCLGGPVSVIFVRNIHPHEVREGKKEAKEET